MSADAEVKARQIKQREEEYPDDVNEVPIEAADFDRRVVVLGELALLRHQDHRGQEAGADDHMQRVQPSHQKVNPQEDLHRPLQIGRYRMRLLLLRSLFRRKWVIQARRREEMVFDLRRIFDVFDPQEDKSQNQRDHEKGYEFLPLAP